MAVTVSPGGVAENAIVHRIFSASLEIHSALQLVHDGPAAELLHQAIDTLDQALRQVRDQVSDLRSGPGVQHRLPRAPAHAGLHVGQPPPPRSQSLTPSDAAVGYAPPSAKSPSGVLLRRARQGSVRPGSPAKPLIPRGLRTLPDEA